MKKLLLACLCIVCISGFALYSQATTAPGIEMVPDGFGMYAPVQGIAPNYRKDVTLTGKSQTIDVTSDSQWIIHTASDAKYRTMSSATKTGIQHTMSNGGGEVVNHGVTSKVYLNLSGATGTLRRR